MKKALRLAIIACLFTTVSNAQIAKGSLLLGTDLGFSSSKASDSIQQNKQSSFSFSPSIGFAVKENTVLGLQVYSGMGKTQYYLSYPVYKTTTYGAGIFLRRYLPLGKAVYLFGEGEAYGMTTNGKQTSTDYTSTSKETRIGLSAYPGVMYTVTRRFQLEAGLANLIAFEYRNSKYENKYANAVVKTEQKTFSASTTLGGYTAFNLGFRFLL